LLTASKCNLRETPGTHGMTRAEILQWVQRTQDFEWVANYGRQLFAGIIDSTRKNWKGGVKTGYQSRGQPFLGVGGNVFICKSELLGHSE